jgi:hypothetical protein
LYQATDAAPNGESETTITCTSVGGSRIEVLTTSKLHWNPCETRTELSSTPQPKTRKEFKERAILPVAGMGSQMDWVPAREPSDWSFVNCTFTYQWGTNGV